MPVHFLAQIRIPTDGGQPRDDMVVNPCFRHNGVAPIDEDNFCNDLAVAVHGKLVGGPRPVTVKLYDLEGSKPVYPAGMKELNKANAAPAVALPRELAVCLSFYGNENRPRNRGRLYIPWCCMTTDNSSLTARPGTTVRSAVGSWASMLSALGGVDWDWIVWSRVNAAATQVQNYFVDDEWDIVRRRGGRPTTRLTGTTTG